MANGKSITKGKTNATQGNARVAGLHGRKGTTGKGRGGHQSVGNSIKARVTTLGGGK